MRRRSPIGYKLCASYLICRCGINHPNTPLTCEPPSSLHVGVINDGRNVIIFESTIFNF